MELKILVIGDLLLDRWITGRFYKITNEWSTPKRVIIADREQVTLGGAGNAATKLASLNGCEITFLVAGEVSFTDELVGPEPTRDLRFKHLPDTGYRVPEKVRVIAVDCDDRCRYDWDKGWQNIDDKPIIKYIKSASPDAVLISDYGKGVCTTDVCQAAICSSGISVVDPKGVSWDKYRGATIIKANADELQETGIPPESLASRLGSELVITHGHERVELYHKDGSQLELFDVPQIKFVDATGAGDMFSAALTLDYVKRQDIKAAIRYAIQCASTSVSHLGTGLNR